MIDLKQDKSVGYLFSIEKGGSGSGNFAHEGRPGEVGGSSSDGEIDGESGDKDKKSDYQAKKRQWEKNLTQPELDAITKYTSAGFKAIRRCMNESLGCTENVKEYIKNFTKALDSAPKYEGLTYRGLHFKSFKERDEFLARVVRDGKLLDKGFVSTTRHRELSVIFAGNPKTESNPERVKNISKSVLIRLNGKTGVDVTNLSKYKGLEISEVIMKPGREWKLKNIKKDYYGQRHSNTYMTILNMDEL